MKIAVVGAGLFGSVIALELSKKHNVYLFEQKKDIMQCASGINQFRLHKGYHYPRSKETLFEIDTATSYFNDYFKNDIFVKSNNYYAIPRKGSKTSVSQFIDFCEKNNLFIRKNKLHFLNYDKISQSFEVKEKVINPFLLKNYIKQLLDKSNINVKLNTKYLHQKQRMDFDLIILCVYGNDYQIAKDTINTVYKFQLVEKMLISIPKIDKQTSLVVVDGPFFCIDPYAETKNFLIGHVNKTVLSQNVGFQPNFDNKYIQYLHSGLQTSFPYSNFNNIINDASKYMPIMANSKYHGSFLVIRCVKPNVEITDERTSSINFVSDNLITIHSGKLVSCVSIAKKLFRTI